MSRTPYHLVLLTALLLGSAPAIAQVDAESGGSIYLLSGLTGNILAWGFPAVLHKISLGDGQLLSTASIATGGGGEGFDFIAAVGGVKFQRA